MQIAGPKWQELMDLIFDWFADDASEALTVVDGFQDPGLKMAALLQGQGVMFKSPELILEIQNREILNEKDFHSFLFKLSNSTSPRASAPLLSLVGNKNLEPHHREKARNFVMKRLRLRSINYEDFERAAFSWNEEEKSRFVIEALQMGPNTVHLGFEDFVALRKGADEGAEAEALVQGLCWSLMSSHVKGGGKLARFPLSDELTKLELSQKDLAAAYPILVRSMGEMRGWQGALEDIRSSARYSEKEHAGGLLAVVLEAADDESAMNFVGSLNPEIPGADQLIRRGAQHFLYQDLDAVSAWINTLPEGSVKKIAASEMVKRLEILGLKREAAKWRRMAE